MTPQRERAVERVRELMDWEPDWVEEMMATTVPEFAEEREMTKAAASGWERAIVAEGLLERWMLSAKQDDFVTMDVDLHARHVAHKAESLDALVADTRSFLSAEGE